MRIRYIQTAFLGMKPIAIFFHCLFQLEDELLPAAIDIVHSQMWMLKACGLLDAASEMIVGCNGGEESRVFCETILPAKAKVSYHGLKSRNECVTIRLIEEWLPGHKDWYVLYFHSKGATHPPGDDLRTTWRECMMRHLIAEWRFCVNDLARGYDAAGCHWIGPPITPPEQYIFAGTFFWARASFLMTLPSIMDRARIRMSGLGAFESRFESEVWLGNGPKLPVVRDYHPNWTLFNPYHP